MIYQRRIGFGIVAAAGIVMMLFAPTDSGAAGLRCAEDAECASGQICRQGVCRTACMGDGDCNAAASEACVVGQCMPAFPIRYPVDYGLGDGTRQPGCSFEEDCQPTIACVGGVCQLPDGCVPSPQNEARDEFCPPFGGYKCNKTSKFCEGPACNPAMNGADCAAAYSIAGLHCISGRCTSSCMSNADCCPAGTRCPAARVQNVCFQVDPSAPGVCAREIADGRLIAYQIANRDPRPPLRNIILVSEGFRFNASNRTELDHFVNQALKHIQWQTTRADMLAALLSPSLFNIFILELPDRAAGLGQSTLFGHFKLNADQTTQQFPGSDDQVRFMTKQALLGYMRGLTPALTPAPSVNDNPTVFHVVLYNDNSGRAHSNGGDMIFQLVTNDDGAGFSTDSQSRYFVLQHELGHSLGRVADEYDNDRESGSPPMCQFNTVPRTTVTDPPCDECTSSTFHPENAPWGKFVNTTTFPTTTGDLGTVGLYAGANARFRLKAMRSQNDCTMRQGGRQDYCTACREALMHNVIGDQISQSFRFLDMPNAMLVPTEAGVGPNVAVAVDTTTHHAYMTREINGGTMFSDIDGDALTREGVRDISLTSTLGGAGIPRTITPFGQFVAMEGIHPTDPSKSKVLIYDTSAHTLGPAVSIPGMLGTPVSVSGGAVGAFTVYRKDQTTSENQMAFVDIGTTGPGAPTFSVPTSRAGGMPRLEQAPVLGTESGRLFFPATKVTPAETFCDFDSCQIWVFDPATRLFVDPILTVTTPGVAQAGIVAMTIGQHPSGMAATLPGELLIAVTDNQVLVWQTAQILAGNTAPAASFAHSLGGTSLVTGVGFVPQTEQIVLTNRAGVVAVYGVTGTGQPDGDRITIPGLAPGMQIRDLNVRPDGAAYLVAGGFSGPRAGVIAVLDLTGNRSGAERVVFTQSVSGIGLARPAIAVDDANSVVYTNAVLESGDATGIDNSHRFRSPLVRGLHEHAPSLTGCP